MRERRWVGLVAAALWLTVLAGLDLGPAGASPTPAAAPERLRLMVVGDSMTQGSSGDWTWRYRLWHHLTDAGVPVELVGPRTDLYDNLTMQSGDHSYVDPSFDQDHAAQWGMSLAFFSAAPPTGLGHGIRELVAVHRPQVVLELMGVNDLAFLHESPEEVRDLLRSFVADARAADPQVDVVLGRIPQPWRDDVRAFNVLVDGLAQELDSAASRVVVADADAGYDRAEDTWDDAHPNSHGELKIAAAFEDALHGLGIGPPAVRPIPDVPRGPRIPPVLTAVAAESQVALDWVRSPGAGESEIWLRDVTADGPWQQVAQHLTGTSYTVTGLPAWHRVQVRTAPVKGAWVAAPDAWSNVVGAEVLGAGLDPPAARAAATADGTVTVRWAPVLGATAYAVQGRPADQPGVWFDFGTTGGDVATVSDLLNRTGYTFRVRALRGGLASAWSAEAPVVVPALPAVRGVRVSATARGVRTRARPVASADSYTLRVAVAARCRRPPGAGRFVVVASGLTRARTSVRLEARAVWVRWVAVRHGVEGELARSSTACTRLPG